MKEVPLTRGFTALVDDGDHAALSHWRWQCGPGGYAVREGGRVRMHVLLMEPGPGLVVDHWNGDPMDNQRGNLVVCTQAENMRNNPHRRVEFGRWLPCTSAARLLGLKEHDVWLLTRAGELPVEDFGTRLLLPRAGVLPFETPAEKARLAVMARRLRLEERERAEQMLAREKAKP